MQECINVEIKIKDKLCNLITLNCALNQYQVDFESFINNFELNMDSIMVNNFFLTVFRGGFNNNINIATYKGSKNDGIASQFGLQQIIKEPTHIFDDSSSCTELIFTT